MENKYDKLEVYIGRYKKQIPDGYSEQCDSETGECRLVKSQDGLIERVVNKSVQVETKDGIKRLLND